MDAPRPRGQRRATDDNFEFAKAPSDQGAGGRADGPQTEARGDDDEDDKDDARTEAKDETARGRQGRGAEGDEGARREMRAAGDNRTGHGNSARQREPCWARRRRASPTSTRGHNRVDMLVEHVHGRRAIRRGAPGADRGHVRAVRISGTRGRLPQPAGVDSLSEARRGSAASISIRGGGRRGTRTGGRVRNQGSDA